jgi:hypothetical protein
VLLLPRITSRTFWFFARYTIGSYSTVTVLKQVVILQAQARLLSAIDVEQLTVIL